jgi:chromosome segregation protein
MRLKSINLAGFKSFVDSTCVNLPGNLVAIVGPNGCGKSNIIDAVRWVMGESSAKYLRGESMADVIFNGSTSRKPVAQATIELIFDQCEGKLAGQFAQYSQISVMRQVTRDGQSQYYLNGAHCRRKDITDLFLGTGLGPRSYSIIMQDTVTRLIEAKPEELRGYLEEAAGISKYKERRHETELRIKHTKENLDRLNDIRTELEKQQNHLQQQAKTAERYKEYKQNERLLRVQIHTTHWHQHEKSLSELSATTTQVEAELTLQQLNSATKESNLAASQQQLHDATQHLNNVHQAYYAASADIAKLEQRKQYTLDQHQQLSDEIRITEGTLHQAKKRLADEEISFVDVNQQIDKLSPEIKTDESESVNITQELQQAESTLQQWQGQWDEFHALASKTQQTERIEATRIQQLEQRIKDSQTKLNKLIQEKNTIDVNQLEQLLQQSAVKLQEVRDLQQQLEHELAQVEEKTRNQQAEYENHQSEFNLINSNLQRCKEQIATLTAHQQAALGQTDNAMMGWLKQHNLSELPRLGEVIKVISGWEQAVETVLQRYMEGICVDNIADKIAPISNVQQSNIILIDNQYNHCKDVHSVSRPTLADQITATEVIKNYLRYIYIAENLDEALQFWHELNPQESIITRDGIWLGPGWIKISKAKHAKSGVLARQKQLTLLQHEEQTLVDKVQFIQNQLQNLQQSLRALNQEREKFHQQLRQMIQMQSQVTAEHQVKTKELERSKNNLNHLVQAINESNQQFEKLQIEIETARDNWKKATSYIEEHESTRNQLMQQRKYHQDKVVELREKSNKIKDQLHKKALQLSGLTHRQHAMKDNLHRTQQHISELTLRLEQAQQKIQQLTEPLQKIQVELEQTLQNQLNAENQLTEARQQTQTIEHEIALQNKERHQLENEIQNLRVRLEKLRMEMQNHTIRKDTILEQLREFDISLEMVQTTVSDNLSLPQLEEDLIKLTKRIERLGPINLAAIDEFKEVSERKTYLDTQNDDLLEALNRLEDAIRKIDQETRSRFKEIFERVNNNFATIFPKIFAGGSAYLELTSDDLLETGVSVMARPAGKRNSTIHLLSGGEKALTALTLVFALFQLNPAPFCMLDEVDASLDDSNVNRFCNLVKEMSQEVQCIFISHNKLTIEMATHLIGVTMHEPGASRLVAVDIDKMVATAGA